MIFKFQSIEFLKTRRVWNFLSSEQQEMCERMLVHSWKEVVIDHIGADVKSCEIQDIPLPPKKFYAVGVPYFPPMARH